MSHVARWGLGSGYMVTPDQFLQNSKKVSKCDYTLGPMSRTTFTLASQWVKERSSPFPARAYKQIHAQVKPVGSGIHGNRRWVGAKETVVISKGTKSCTDGSLPWRPGQGDKSTSWWEGGAKRWKLAPHRRQSATQLHVRHPWREVNIRFAVSETVPTTTLTPHTPAGSRERETGPYRPLSTCRSASE